jgi:hypothetical protein
MRKYFKKKPNPDVWVKMEDRKEVKTNTSVDGRTYRTKRYMLLPAFVKETGLRTDFVYKKVQNRWNEQGKGLAEVAVVRIFVTRGWKYAIILNDVGFRFKMEVIGRNDCAVKEYVPLKTKSLTWGLNTYPDWIQEIEPKNLRGWVDDGYVWLSKRYCSNNIYNVAGTTMNNIIRNANYHRWVDRIGRKGNRLFIRFRLDSLNYLCLVPFNQEVANKVRDSWTIDNSYRLESILRKDYQGM